MAASSTNFTPPSLTTADEDSIVEWCQKQTVFVTGGSGFVGKALIFKLLQCGVNRIYVLIRSKKGQTPEQRLDVIANQEIYKSIRAKDPYMRSKLVAVVGDITEPGLAISEEDKEVLQDNVTVIFHSAASVKFDDSLTKAVFHNLRSTRDCLELAKGVKNLKMFHYVSTAYCNCEHMYDQNGVEEKFYDAKMDYNKLITLVETTPEEVVNGMEMKILGSSPNTYIFSKHMAEAAMGDASKTLPIVISRPPIVMQSLKEPYPGWTNNLSSPIALIVGTAKGFMRIYLGDPDAPKAYIPVDIAANTIIASTWMEAVKNKEDRLTIYNMEYTPINTGQIRDVCFDLIPTEPFKNSIWAVHLFIINSVLLFKIGHLFLHIIPGIIFDTLLRLTGNEPRLIRLYRKLYTVLMLLYPFGQLFDKFVTENVKKLKLAIPKKEIEIFHMNMPHDMPSITVFFKFGAQGARAILGEPPIPTKKEFIHQKRLIWLDKCFQGILAVSLVWYFPFVGLYNYFTFTLQSLNATFHEIIQ